MKKGMLFSAIFVLVLASLACNININVPDVKLPQIDVKTGPTINEDIFVESPKSDEADVRIEFGAGRLSLSPGAEQALIEGTASYNVEDLKPEITTRGSKIEISTGKMEFKGIPNFSEDLKNEWDLKFGNSPVSLTIEAGAYQGEYEFGGLSLLDLEITDGASEVTLSFSEPNLVEMDTLRYSTGASSIKMNSLANANTGEMEINCGAGSYTLDFSGELKQDMDVRIKSGVSQVTIIIPEGVPARLNYTGALTNVDTGTAWEKDGNEYLIKGEGPEITIEIEMAAGSLDLRND